MKINVYFGEIGLPNNYLYLDKQPPLKQVNDIRELNYDFSILTYSPYIVEAIDAMFSKEEIKYFLDGTEVSLVTILSKISEAYYLIVELENK